MGVSENTSFKNAEVWSELRWIDLLLEVPMLD